MKEQVPVRLTGAILQTVHDKWDASRVRLLRQIANTHSITWVVEGHHEVRVQGNGSCVFPRRKKILREVDARDVVVMRSFGEQIQDVLVFPAITHNVVQHENAWSQMFGEQSSDVFWDTLVEVDPFALHVLETTLGFSVALHDPSDGSIKSM